MDVETFTREIIPYKNKLYRIALRIVGNNAEAEDVVQEVFIKLWKKRDELHQLKNKEAWCVTMTKNLSIDKTRSKHHQYGFVAPGMDLVDQAVTPDRVTESNDTMSRLRKLMDTLPDKYRRVMEMRDIEGSTYKEISETLNMPLEQVKVNIFRARQKMKNLLVNTQSYGL